MFLAFFGFDWMMKLINGDTVNENLNYMTDYKMSSEAFDFIADYEDFASKAYKLPYENLYTIGYGSTKIYSDDGKSSRNVRAGETITKSEAIKQMRLYYERSGSVKNEVDNIIKNLGVKLHQRFYDMVCEASYTSGSFHKKSSFVSIYVNMLQRANGSVDLPFLGELIKNTWITYCKNHTGVYFTYGLGWSRRAYGMSQYVQKKNWKKSNSVSSVKKAY